MAEKKQNIKLIFAIVLAAVFVVAGIITAVSNGGTQALFGTTGLINNVSEEKMIVNFIDVGQGDCTLITCEGTAILIDTGEYSECQRVISYIKNQGVKKLDLVIGTHPHSDHIGSMGKILKYFPIGDVIMPEIPEKLIPTTSSYERFMLAAADRAKNVIRAVPGQTYNYGKLRVDILGPVGEYDSLNNYSVIAKVSYGETSVMFSGDAENIAEKNVLKKKYSFNANLMKVGHHGSRDASSSGWLKAVNPQYAVISCGINNDYGHPHKKALNRLEKNNIKYYRTDLLGDIVFVSDGKIIEHLEEGK